MDEAIDDASFQQIETELKDRYGRLPKPVVTLLRQFRLKHGLMGLGLHSVQWVENERLVVRHPAGVPLGGSWLDHFKDVRPVEAGKTHLILPKARRGNHSAEGVLEFLLGAITSLPKRRGS